jgi:exopolyphosphatase/guanosine-5'-triphosphate,3'-diphosphate pyrophosphatase
VLLCRNRAEPRLGEIQASLTHAACALEFSDGWLERRPLTQRAFEEESGHWKAVGIAYRAD